MFEADGNTAIMTDTDSVCNREAHTADICRFFTDIALHNRSPDGVVDWHAGSVGYSLRPNQSETYTKPISTGTSTSGPTTAANACPDAMPKTLIATAMANSKLLLAAVKEMVAVSA